MCLCHDLLIYTTIYHAHASLSAAKPGTTNPATYRKAYLLLGVMTLKKNATSNPLFMV
jgi:hypothetical protein